MTLFSYIKEYGFFKGDFTIDVKQSQINHSEPFTQIKHKNYDYYFNFKNEQNSFLCVFSPGNETYVDETFTSTWDNSVYCFLLWLQYLIREIESGYKWEEYINSQSKINFDFDDSNSIFEPKEKVNIGNSIESTKSILEQSGKYSTNELDVINKKLDYLVKKTENTNKFDWKIYFIGIIGNIFLQCAFSPESAIFLWNTLKSEFNSTNTIE